MDTAIKKNIQTIYCMTFCQSAMVVSAIFVPLLQRHDLTMAQVLQTQALFALVIAASEVPSGYLADIWGRKRALRLGQGLMALAYGWFVFADSFADFMIFEVVMGFGISLCSGADLALLYDSQKALTARGENTSGGGNHIARLVAVESYASALAAILASVLTLWSLDWVLWAQAIFALAGFGFSLRLTEVERHISLDNHSDNAAKVAAVIVRQPLVLWTAAAIIVFGLASLLGFWLMQKYWESQQVPLYWFGYIWAVHNIVRGLSAHIATALEDYLGWRKLFLLVALLPIIGFCGMGLLGGWMGIIFGLLLPLGRGLSAVVFAEALNKRLESTFRATVNSVVSLGTRLLFMFTGPLLGYMVDMKGVGISFLGLAALFVPVYLLVLLALARSIKREPEPVLTG